MVRGARFNGLEMWYRRGLVGVAQGSRWPPGGRSCCEPLLCFTPGDTHATWSPKERARALIDRGAAGQHVSRVEAGQRRVGGIRRPSRAVTDSDLGRRLRWVMVRRWCLMWTVAMRFWLGRGSARW